MGDPWITGIGLITSLGPDRSTTWRRLIAGESGIGPVSVFDTSGFRGHLAAQVRTEPRTPPCSPVSERRLSRASRFALAAAAEALDDAGLQWQTPEPRPWGLVLSGGTAGLLEAESFVARRLRGGPLTRGLTEFLEVPQDAPTDRLAQVCCLTGPRITVTTACSSSTIAVGMAADMVAAGEVSVALAGGSDGLSRLTFAGFNALRAMALEPCRPFDLHRRGLILGEGAAILVIEDAQTALARGAQPYARVAGYGVTNDAFHMTQPEPSGEAWARTIETALAAARCGESQVDYINAHGTATEQNDVAECAAYGRVFGSRLAAIPVSSVKGALGHCLNAAGGVEAAITSLAMRHGVVPPTVGFAQADPACPVDPVPNRGRKHQVNFALSCSFAFGGNSSALVLERVG